jgi:hydrogenase expression/formation protein HypE
MRDATRGGLAAVLHEWAAASGRTLVVEEARLPVDASVRGACELLGLDPLHVAGEGVFAVAVPAGWGAAAAAALRSAPVAGEARVVGSVLERGPAPAVVQRVLGRVQPLDDPLGAPLPRIC